MYYGPILAVNGADLQIDAGEIVALVGPNGAGKTTLIESLQGYREPHSGQVRIFGVDPRQHRHDITSRWGVMPQAGGIPMGLTVEEAVQLFAALYQGRGHATAVADHAIGVTGLSSLRRRRWRRLSGGQQQRLSLALALCGGRELLLLDEPTSALDSEGQRQVLELIAEQSHAGSAVLFSSHQFTDIEQIAGRVVVMYDAQIVRDERVDALMAMARTIRVRARSPLDQSQVDLLQHRINAPIHRVTISGAASSNDGDHWLDITTEASADHVATVSRALADSGIAVDQMLIERRPLAHALEETLALARQQSSDRTAEMTSTKGSPTR